MTSRAILVCDCDTLFREALRNFLLAAGYIQIEVVTTLREALAKMRRERYCCIIVGVSRLPRDHRRFFAVLQRRQPGTKVLLLVSANNSGNAKYKQADYVTREHAFSILPEWLKQTPDRNSSNLGMKI